MNSDSILHPGQVTQTRQPVVRGAAKFISYIFHPLFVPLYAGLFIIYEARLFPDRTPWQQRVIFLQFVLYYTFLPLVTTLLCKGLGFIESIYLTKQKDRIIPFILCEIFYFWSWYVFRNLHPPREVIIFTLGVFLATSLGLIMNAYMKISMHAISMGVVTSFILMAAMRSDMSYGYYIAAAFIMTGLTLTARFLVSDHTTREVYVGYGVGVMATCAAYVFS